MRRFIERFKTEVGVTPKRYCRLLRFQRALARAHGGDSVDWGDLALACGYFDQAHLIHEFRDLSGLTPTAYKVGQTLLQNHVNSYNPFTASPEENQLMADPVDRYRTLTPYLVVPDADAEMRFLKAAFGATEAVCRRNADQSVMHAELNVGDSLLMLGQAGGKWKALPAALHTWLPDVDAAYARALAAGAASQFAPEDKPYGHRTAGVVDRNGITWWISSPIR